MGEMKDHQLNNCLLNHIFNGTCSPYESAFPVRELPNPVEYTNKFN